MGRSRCEMGCAAMVCGARESKEAGRLEEQRGTTRRRAGDTVWGECGDRGLEESIKRGLKNDESHASQ